MHSLWPDWTTVSRPFGSWTPATDNSWKWTVRTGWVSVTRQQDRHKRPHRHTALLSQGLYKTLPQKLLAWPQSCCLDKNTAITHTLITSLSIISMTTWQMSNVNEVKLQQATGLLSIMEESYIVIMTVIPSACANTPANTVYVPQRVCINLASVKVDIWCERCYLNDLFLTQPELSTTFNRIQVEFTALSPSEFNQLLSAITSLINTGDSAPLAAEHAAHHVHHVYTMFNRWCVTLLIMSSSWLFFPPSCWYTFVSVSSVQRSCSRTGTKIFLQNHIWPVW